MTRFEAIKQGHIKIVDISIVCNFTVDKCELNPAYVIKKYRFPQKDLLNGQKKRSSSENRITYSIKLADEKISAMTRYYLICACISCTETTFSVASAFSAIAVAKPPFRVVS